jgi:hypothetical protein
MDNIKLEEKFFYEILCKNFETLSKLWTPSIPFSYSLDQHKNTVVERLRTEKDVVTPEYKGVKILYTIDENGYRNYPDLNRDSKKKIFCFGCSYTFGYSIPDNHTWPYQLGKMFGEDYDVKNYGMPGSSIGFSARTFYQIINNTRAEDYPEAVFFLFPDPFRTFYISHLEKTILGQHHNLKLYVTKNYDEYKKDKKHEYSQHHYAKSSVVDSFFRFVKYYNFIKEIANNRGIPWYWYTWYPYYLKINKSIYEKYIDLSNTYTNDVGIVPIEFFGYGRDGTHWNGKTNEQVAEIFYKLRKK